MTRTFGLRAAAASLGLVLGLAVAGLAHAAEGGEPLKSVRWSFAGPFGQFDKAQLQRGFKVYKEVCSACHAMHLVAIRSLGDDGGPGFTEEQVKVIAAEYTVQDGPNDDGDMFDRPGLPRDRFPSPYPNDKAAAASNGGAVPPDFSVLAKAREDGPNYIVSLMTGYEENPPAGSEVPEGKYYNHYFPGHAISMPPPLSDELVEYTDGTPPTVENYAKDVAAFMMWTAEPKMEHRKRMGFVVMVFLVIFATLLYLTKRKIWSDIEH